MVDQTIKENIITPSGTWYPAGFLRLPTFWAPPISGELFWPAVLSLSRQAGDNLLNQTNEPLANLPDFFQTSDESLLDQMLEDDDNSTMSESNDTVRDEDWALDQDVVPFDLLATTYDDDDISMEILVAVSLRDIIAEFEMTDSEPTSDDTNSPELTMSDSDDKPSNDIPAEVLMTDEESANDNTPDSPMADEDWAVTCEHRSMQDDGWVIDTEDSLSDIDIDLDELEPITEEDRNMADTFQDNDEPTDELQKYDKLEEIF